MWWKGAIVWSITLTLLCRAVPRLAPHRPRLARFAIGCFGLVLLDALYSWFSGRPAAYQRDQGVLLDALDFIAFAGILISLICGAVVLFTDTRQSD